MDLLVVYDQNQDPISVADFFCQNRIFQAANFYHFFPLLGGGYKFL